jgi:hypothetical protein
MFACGNPAHHRCVDRLPEAAQGETTMMHDVLIALAFIGMVVAPALIAARSGGQATEE